MFCIFEAESELKMVDQINCYRILSLSNNLSERHSNSLLIPDDATSLINCCHFSIGSHQIWYSHTSAWAWVIMSPGAAAATSVLRNTLSTQSDVHISQLVITFDFIKPVHTAFLYIWVILLLSGSIFSSLAALFFIRTKKWKLDLQQYYYINYDECLMTCQKITSIV